MTSRCEKLSTIEQNLSKKNRKKKTLEKEEFFKVFENKKGYQIVTDMIVKSSSHRDQKLGEIIISDFRKKSCLG